MLKRIKTPERFRLGYEYNELLTQHEFTHELLILSMQKNAELQGLIDQLTNLAVFYEKVEKEHRHFYGAGIIGGTPVMGG